MFDGRKRWPEETIFVTPEQCLLNTSRVGKATIWLDSGQLAHAAAQRIPPGHDRAVLFESSKGTISSNDLNNIGAEFLADTGAIAAKV